MFNYILGNQILEPFVNKNITMEIKGMKFLLTTEEQVAAEKGYIMEETDEEYFLREETPAWYSEKYKILGIPGYFGTPIYVEVLEIKEDGDEDTIGIEEYGGEVENFEHYTKIVKFLTEKILDKSKTQ